MAKKRSRPKKKAKKKYQIEMSSLSLCLWGFCLFFLLAWIFVLGILVGRGFLPGGITAISDLKSQFGKLGEIVDQDGTKRLDPPKKTDPEPELAFYEKLSNKKTEAKTPPKKETKSPPKKDMTGPTKTPGQQTLGGLETMEKRRKGDVKASPPERDPKDYTDKMMYTVQLASLGNKKKAEALIKDLEAKGYPAYFYDVRVKGRTYYRVRCGRFASRREAGRYSKEMERKAGIKGFVSRLE